MNLSCTQTRPSQASRSPTPDFNVSEALGKMVQTSPAELPNPPSGRQFGPALSDFATSDACASVNKANFLGNFPMTPPPTPRKRQDDTDQHDSLVTPHFHHHVAVTKSPKYSEDLNPRVISQHSTTQCEDEEIVISVKLPGAPKDDAAFKRKAEFLSRILTDALHREPNAGTESHRIVLQDPPKGRQPKKVTEHAELNINDSSDDVFGENLNRDVVHSHTILGHHVNGVCDNSTRAKSLNMAVNPVNITGDTRDYGAFSSAESNFQNSMSNICRGVPIMHYMSPGRPLLHNNCDLNGNNNHYSPIGVRNEHLVGVAPQSAYLSGMNELINKSPKSDPPVSPLKPFSATPKSLESGRNYFVFPDVNATKNPYERLENPTNLCELTRRDDVRIPDTRQSESSQVSTSLGSRPISSVHPSSPLYDYRYVPQNDLNAIRTDPGPLRRPETYTSVNTNTCRAIFENNNPERCFCHGDVTLTEQLSGAYVCRDDISYTNRRDIELCKRNLFGHINQPQPPPQQLQRKQPIQQQQSPSITDDVIDQLTSRGIITDEQARQLSFEMHRSVLRNDLTCDRRSPHPAYQVIVLPRSSQQSNPDNCTRTGDVIKSRERSLSCGHMSDGYTDQRTTADSLLGLAHFLTNDNSERAPEKRTKRKRECDDGGNSPLKFNPRNLADDLGRHRKKGRQQCECDDLEHHVLNMAQRAYQKVRRRNNSTGAFDQFQRELTQTNGIVFDSLRMLRDMKRFCSCNS